MAEDKISSLFDTTAIEKELDGIINKSLQKVKGFGKLKVAVEGASSLKEFSLVQTKMITEMKAVENLAKQRYATDAKIITLQSDYAKATANNTVEIAKQNKELKAQAAAEQASIGSRDRALAQIKVLTIEKDKLNLLNADEAKQYDVLVAKIEKYDNFLKRTGTTAEKQRANIGNYSGAINILKSSLDEVSKKIDANTRAGKGNSEATKQMVKEQSILRTLVDSQAAGFAKGAMEVRANEKALLDLAKAGLQGSEAYKQLALATGKLKDDLADVKARTKALGSDTFVFDGLIQGAQTLAGVYGVAQGAAALFGDENKELQKTFVKLQAVMTVIQGLQSIANGIQKENAAILLIQQVREKALLVIQTLRNFVMRGSVTAQVANTVATRASTGAMVANTVATRVATTAAIGFRAALIATGIGAILVLLASAASAMSTFGDSTEDTSGKLEDFANKLNRIDRELSNTQEAIKLQNSLQIEYLKQRGAGQAEIDAKEIEGYKYTAEASKDAANKKVQDADRLLKANGAVIKGVITNAAEAAQIIDKLDNYLTTTLAKSSDQDQVEAIKKAKEAIQGAYDLYKESEKTTTDIKIKEEQNKTKAAEAGFASAKKRREEELKRSIEYAERERKAIFQILKDSAEERASLFLKDSQNEELPLKERLNALLDYNNERQSILIAQKDFDLANEKLTATEKEAIINKFGIESNALLRATEETRLQIIKAAKKEELEAYKKAFDDLQKLQEQKLETSQFKSEQARNAELLQLQKDFAAGKIATAEELSQKEKEINDKYDKIALDAEIKHQLALLVIRKAAGLDVDAQLKALQELKDQADKKEIENAKATSDKLIENKEKEKEKKLALEKELAEKKKELIQETEETLFSLVQSGIDREIQSLDERKRLLDEDTAKRINSINLLGLTEVERVRQVAIVEKNAMFQTEQIERRKRELAAQKAKFEKAQSIAAIIQSTSQAIMAALGSKPWTPANIALAAVVGSIGALQLARAVATPIPKFKTGKGKDNKYEGPAIVNDGGKREPILREDGTIEYPKAMNTLTYLAKNDMVFPDINSLVDAIHNRDLKPMDVKVNNYTDPELRNIMQKQTGILKDISKKSGIIIHNYADIKSKAWYLDNFKN